MTSAMFSLVQGFQSGLTAAEEKRSEDSVGAGGNSYLRTALQLAQGASALGFSARAAETAGLPQVSWIGRSVVYLTPIFLAIFKNNSYVPEQIRPILAPLHNHLGTFYHTVCIASSVTLLFYGQTFFAASSLCVLGIGLMDRNGLLPHTSRQFLHGYAPALLTAASVFAGGIIERLFAIFSGLSWCIERANTYFPDTKVPRETFTIRHNLTPELADDYFEGRLYLELNPKFVHYTPLLGKAPDIDIQCFIEHFDQIDWTSGSNLPTLRSKLKTDLRFIERHEKPELKTDEELIAIAKASLQSFIDSVKKRCILEGEPADYDKLHNYLRWIADYVQNQKDNVTKTDILLRLAIEGGEYCGPGKFEVAESVLASTVGENSNISFEDKVFYCLQNERTLWMRDYYREDTSSAIGQLLGRVIDWNDVHHNNSFVQCYGDGLGLRMEAANNDDTALLSPFFKWAFSHSPLKAQIDRAFWHHCTLGQQVETILAAIGTPELPKPEFYTFWQNWIERQEIDEEAKEALRKKLAKARLFDQPMEVNGKIRYEFIRLMLLDMGIAKI